MSMATIIFLDLKIIFLIITRDIYGQERVLPIMLDDIIFMFPRWVDY